MGPETPEWHPSPDELLEGKFGPEITAEADRISKSIFEQIKVGIIDIGMGEGTSQEQQVRVEKYLEMWREFSRGLFDRTSSVNAKSPEKVEIAVEGVNSLLSTKPTSEGEEAAKRLIEALNERYK